MLATELSKPRRIELILRKIDSLPTLPAIATRLLSFTASDDAQAREVTELVSADPALTAKVLSLCRSTDKGVHSEVLTIDRAVVLLGFNAIRNAVLSVKVVEMFNRAGGRDDGANGETSREGLDGQAEDESGQDPAEDRFDRVALWSHCLSVAVLAESIAEVHQPDPQLAPGEAFVCGLLHDVGKFALDHVLPKSFARVIELTHLNQGNIAEFERRIVGIDHHTAGKRLAEQWRLAHALQDCIWLHGSNYESLPHLAHRRMIGLISLADLIAREQHVGYSGNYTFTQQADQLMKKIGLQPRAVNEATGHLHEQLQWRGKALGLHAKPYRDLFL